MMISSTGCGQEAAQTRRRFGEVLNERLRLGYAAQRAGGKPAPEFKVEPFLAKGFATGVDPKKLNRMLDIFESQKLRS